MADYKNVEPMLLKCYYYGGERIHFVKIKVTCADVKTIFSIFN